jgi:hypothetical protein
MRGFDARVLRRNIYRSTCVHEEARASPQGWSRTEQPCVENQLLLVLPNPSHVPWTNRIAQAHYESAPRELERSLPTEAKKVERPLDREQKNGC